MTDESAETPHLYTRTNDTAAKLVKALRFLVIATCVLYVAFFLAGIKIYLDGRNSSRALCSLRTDLRERVDSSIRFLSENPNGIPGVPNKVIMDQITNQQRTITALKDLNCVSNRD